MNTSKTNTGKSELTEEQAGLLNRINGNLERGDITRISKAANFTKEYVGKVLNPFTATYNEKIVAAAIDLIVERERSRKKMLKKLP